MRFPDIIVVSWQCDCNAYISHSIDLCQINVAVTCNGCRNVYTVAIGDIDVPVSIIAPTPLSLVKSPATPGHVKSADSPPQDGIPV